MKPHPPKRHVAQLLASILLAAFVQSASAQQILLQDNFTTIDTNSTWTRANTGSANSTADGTLYLNSAATGTAQRATLISKSDDFNPFVSATESITLTFSGLVISGTPSVGANNTSGGANAFYAYVGNPANGNGTGNLYSWGEAGSYLSVSIQERVNTNNVAFSQLGFFDRGSAGFSAAANLSGTPTGFSWTIIGTNQQTSITLTDATFISAIAGFTLTNGNSTMVGSFSNYNSTSLGANGSYLAIGSINLTAPVTDPTTASLDSILVTAIPEPSTFALLTIAGAVGGLLLKRRRHGVK